MGKVKRERFRNKDAARTRSDNGSRVGSQAKGNHKEGNEATAKSAKGIECVPMAKRLTDEGHMIRFFMTKSGPECELMLSNLKSIPANRSDVTQPVKKDRKKRAPKSEPSLPLAQGD